VKFDNRQVFMTESRRKPLRPDVIGTLVLLLIALSIALIRPFTGLAQQGHIVFASILAGLAFWIFHPANAPFFTGVCIMFLGCLLAGLPMEAVAGGFGGSALWILIPAMFFGFALMKTGLGKRIAYVILNSIEPSYPMILFGWLVIGIVLSLITPVIMVRFLIMTPIAILLADNCGLPLHSSGRSLLVISSWIISIFPGTAWMNGALYGPTLTSFLPENMRALTTPLMWAKVMGPPWIFITVVFTAVLYLALKPKDRLPVTRAQIAAIYKELGPPTRAEKYCIAIFLLMLSLFATSSLTGLTSNEIMLGGFFLLLISGVIGPGDIPTAIKWDVVMFYGALLAFSSLLEASGITEWLSPWLNLLLGVLSRSPLLFLFGVFLIFLLVRFIDITWGYTLAAFLSMSTPMLYADFGIHPLIMIMIFVAGGNLFFLDYQQPWITQVDGISHGRGWYGPHLRKASWIYFGVVLLTFLVFYPYWRLIGVL